MSNTIPPLLCSTPPPIDFGDEHDDDFGAFESADTEFGQFDGPSLPSTPKYFDKKHAKPVDLPVPEDFTSFTTQQETKITQQVPVESKAEKTKQNSIESQVTIEDYIEQESQPNNIEYSEIEDDSSENFKISYIQDSPVQFVSNDEPPPIDIGYSSETHSPKNSRGESPQSLEFSPENLSDDDDSIEEFQVNETKYDDSTSLPSLKFDAIDLAKSETPVINDKSSSVSEVLTIVVDEKSTISAFEPEKSTEEENNWSENEFQSHETIRPDIDEVEKIPNIENDEEEHSTVESNGAAEQSDNVLEAKVETISKTPDIQPESNLENVNCSVVDESISKSELPSQLEADENDDDFGCDFQEFEGFSGTQTIKDDPPFTIESDAFGPSDPGEFMFEADFSQIQIPSSSSTVPDNPIEKPEIKNDTERSRPNDIDDDFEDFEDFQDFASAKQTEPENTVDGDNGDDDDFGDFNDFQDTTGSSDLAEPTNLPIINVAQIDEKLKTVLEMMFPNEENRTGSVSNDDKNSLKEFNSNLTSNLRELDSAKALEYQWPNSSMKHSLVKALGIDSRNILYGEKWNSSMPRFAANLGFNPLEPLKPMKLTSSSSLSSISSASQQMNVTGKLSSISSTTTTDVPAVKFDWNSSGLVNPLDASHAHTLLLDLDQLVVVANLDKIKLDSSSPCSSASLTTTTTTTIVHPTDATTTANNYINTNNITVTGQPIIPHQFENHYNKYLDDDNKRFDTINFDHVHYNGGGGGNARITDVGINFNNVIIKNSSTYDSTANNNLNHIFANYPINISSHIGFVNESHNRMFDQYLDCRVKEIIHEGKTEKIYASKSNDSDESSEPTSADKSPTVATIFETPKFITPLPDINNDLNEANHHQKAEIIVSSTIENYAHHKIEIENNHIRPSSSLSSSSSCTTFVGPMKETHIYTPSKSENSVSRSVKAGEKCPIDFDYEMAAAGIVINEQVVKKEYHDIVYNPQAQMGIVPQLLEPSIASSDPENIAVVDPNKHFRHRSTISSDVFSPALSAQTLNIIENSAAMNTNPDETIDDFSDFQQNLSTIEPSSAIQTTTSDIQLTADKYSNLQNIQIKNKCDKKPIIEEVATKSNSFDDEFSDFQSVAAPVIQSKPIADLKPKSRTETPTFSDEMILCPAILLPQAIKVENTEPQINWPGNPGIDPDELSRLEKLFPQAKQIVQSNVTNNSIKSNSIGPNKDDDDWSDFISVPAANVNSTTNQMLQAPTPPSKLSTISKTYDDDDWSEFVSSTPIAPLGSANKLPWSVTQMPPPQFNSWNQPNFFSQLPSSNHVASQQGLYKTSPTTIVPTPSKTIYQNNQSLSNGYLNPVAGQHENKLPQMKVLSQQQQQLHHLQYQQQQQQQQQHGQSQQQRNQNILRSQLNMSPSISLIPDMGFAAPKPFINVPRTNFSKK